MNDACFEYKGSERRKHCELVVMVNQRFNDFMEGTKEYRERQEASIKEISASVIDLTKKMEQLQRPYKILIWLLTIITGAFLLDISHWIIGFVKGRISWN